MKSLNISILIVSIGLLLAALALVVVAQNGRTPTSPASVGTAFTYQGVLTDDGQPANGVYDLQFKLYDAASSGQQVGNTVTLNDKSVTNGLFTAELDFGPVFTGEPRYLEIAARPGSSTGAYETLLPRQPLHPAPYAMHADLAAQSTTPKLRYFEPFQEIATAGAHDWEFFTIGQDSYLVVANYRDSPSNNNVNSKIYQWNGSGFDEIQSIATNGAADWEFYTVDSNHYLAVANRRNGANYNIDSKIYRWDNNTNSFILAQTIPTQGGSDWEFFTIGEEKYLVVANFFNGTTYNLNSTVYRWNGIIFEFAYNIPTNGAWDFEFFIIGETPYLAVANAGSDANPNINSQVLQWNGSGFALVQNIPTNKALGWEFFSIGSNNYLAVVNQYDGATYNQSAKIYRWDGTNFTEFQSIPTSGGRELEFFAIGTDHYLAIANSNDGTTNNLKSRTYRWNGTEFIETQAVPTSGATDWMYFTIDSQPYIAVTNFQDGSNYQIDSRIYRAALEGGIGYAP